jgi:tellurite resistance protein TerC
MMKKRSKRQDHPPPRGRQLRRLIIGVIGFTILVIGVAMIVLPGPATIAIPLGLGILATEFIWARRLMKKARGQLQRRGLLPLRRFTRRR